MPKDFPKLAGHTFTHGPIPYTVAWEPNLIKHRIADGSLKVYKKGFILRGTLGWGDGSWLTADDYSAITIMFNELTATAKFFPRPDSQPTRSFNVQITSEFNLTPHQSKLDIGKQLYQGSISFESSPAEITATASVIF